MYQTESVIVLVAVIIHRAIHTKMMTTCSLLLILTHPPSINHHTAHASFDSFWL